MKIECLTKPAFRQRSCVNQILMDKAFWLLSIHIVHIDSWQNNKGKGG